MKLKLTLERGGQADDILVTVDAAATVGSVAAAIAAADPRDTRLRSESNVSLRINQPGPARILPASSTMGEVGLQSGQSVSVIADSGALTYASNTALPAAVLTVLSGPDKGKEFPLPAGSIKVGRSGDNDIRLTDPMVSKRHIRINISDTIEVIDLGSANGTLIEDIPAQRAVVGPTDRILIGDSILQIVRKQSADTSATRAPLVEFNRSPRLDPVYAGVEFTAPEAPSPPQTSRFPLLPLLAPIVMGGILFLATRNALSVVFVALSPLMMVGSFFETRIAGRKAFEHAASQFRSALASLTEQLSAAADAESLARRAEHPSTADIVSAVRGRQPLMWSRRHDRRGFLELRLGLGTQPSRNTVKLPMSNNTTAELWKELVGVRDRFAETAAVPVVAPLVGLGSIGVAGPRNAALRVSRSVMWQIIGCHSPAEVVVCALASSQTSTDWEWLKWVPHTSSDHSPISVDQLAGSPGGCERLVSSLEELLATRVLRVPGGQQEQNEPVVVVLVEDDAPIERSRMVELAERGKAAAIHVVWIAGSVEQIPAACRAFVECGTGSTPSRAGFVDSASSAPNIELEELNEVVAVELARSLAPVIDVGARVDDESDLPRSVSLAAMAGLDIATSADFVLEQWRQSDSLPIPVDAPLVRRKRDATLRALVGQAVSEPLVLDLRSHGPHALVGGTTGSGKSEFLQSWVLGMAAAHSPARVTFLFVDYKGGAAFGECTRLPHAVGLVTDLSPHLVRRALTSLRAELHHREVVLRAKRAKDLLELERRGDPETPPSLVIVIDEFAALVKEVPEFVDGVVDIAQRGRSLGLHLIMATQRPAGVIRDNLRANTNLRIALRMADEADSKDVVGTPQAALFDPSIPGRGLAKLGPGRVIGFQSAYVGGRTSDRPPPPVIEIDEFRFGASIRWEAPTEIADESAASGPTDLVRIVDTITAACSAGSIPQPRVPWQRELADAYDLAKVPQSRTDSELVFGILDDPEHQAQRPVSFMPDRDGSMAVFGTGGSGKSTLLKSLAVVAGLGTRGGPCHVYALDFASRALSVLEHLPHVGAVINSGDDERVTRLLRWLVREIDERAIRYANAGTVGEYRRRAGQPLEPRILVLLDGFGAFRQAYEGTAQNSLFELFQRIVSEGRPVGVHAVITADRYGAVPSALASNIQQRLILRLAGENDYAAFGMPGDVLTPTSPPGRGVFGDYEVQVAVLGGTANTARQGEAIKQLGRQLASGGSPLPAPVKSLPERITLESLPDLVDGLPVLGLADSTLEPIGWVPEGVVVVSGSPHSGRIGVTAALIRSLQRFSPSVEVHRFAPRRSQIGGLVAGVDGVEGVDAVAAAAKELSDRLAQGTPPPGSVAVLLEQVTDFVNTAADGPLQELVKRCRDAEVLVIADSDVSSLGQSWPLLQLLKGPRHGIALQPEQTEGDLFFKTAFPRIGRTEFPPGRGFYVRNGSLTKIQFAIMD